MSAPKLDAFAGLKAKWREEYLSHVSYPTPRHVRAACADELQSGVEQRVRELRDEMLTMLGMPGAAAWAYQKLTAILGEPQS